MNYSSTVRGLLRVMLILLFLIPSVNHAAQNYVVGEGDILKISVYEHPDLTTTARVSGDGIIKFPLIGNVKVDGMTISEISSLAMKEKRSPLQLQAGQP